MHSFDSTDVSAIPKNWTWVIGDHLFQEASVVKSGKLM
jgi:hypothetical protein